MTGFVKPDDSFVVYSKKGRFYLEEEPFFSCIVSVVFEWGRESVMICSWLIINWEFLNPRQKLSNFSTLIQRKSKLLQKGPTSYSKFRNVKNRFILNLSKKMQNKT